MVEKEDTGASEPRPAGGGILEAILEGTSDAVFAKDLDGKYLLVNSACAKFIGRPKEQIIGRDDFELYPPETARRFVEADRVVLESGETQVFEGLAKGAGGTQLFRVTKGVVRDREGRVVGLFGISHDMTERRRAEEERLERARAQAARAEAEEASRMKDLFLATLSHELRTPLTSILGWAIMLDEGGTDETTAREAVKIIRRNAEQQRHIIDDILDASRIIAGKLHIEAQPLELARVVRAAVDVVRPAAEARGIRLSCDLGTPSGGGVVGDPHRLQQVFWNLLSNAVKFTPAGGEVRVEVERLPDEMRVTVSDTGRGISPDFLPHVFDRFRQADSSPSRAQGGLGLGLSLVKYLVEMHGGSVGAHSAGQGQGAVFTVNLPPAPAGPHATEEPAAGGRAQSPALKGLRVLLVDDDEDTLQLLSMLLRKHGVEVASAASAALALGTLEQVRPDLLVSDIGMPEVDGYELMRTVRTLEAEHGRRTPALALTAYAGEGDRQLALDAGFDDHLAKPVEPEALLSAIARLAEKLKNPPR
ncbi:MAG TPA: ATP-binding protein [Pyrinomonadaceae bacterium]|nr:ATP-binding protein [Pyrinomonadaceae bacterium]